MTLTKRGDTVIGVVVLLICGLLVLGAFWVGQALKKDRIQNEHSSLTCQELGYKECSK